uniref:Uncharacterized protein n=1 Tax=Rhizophora mucronata TaxID=61149 RepID=A0A2P2QKF9_RHIMU
MLPTCHIKRLEGDTQSILIWQCQLLYLKISKR